MSEIIFILIIAIILYFFVGNKNVYDNKFSNVENLDIIKQEVRKLINKSTNSVLDIPKKKFSNEFIITFKEYLYNKKDVKISNNILSSIIEEIKLNMYYEELDEKINSDKISNITYFSKKYLDIYGYNIDEDYIDWMIKVFDLNLMVDDVTDEINKIKDSRRKKKSIDEMDKF